MDWGGFDFAATALGNGTTPTAWALSPLDLRQGFVDPTVVRSRLLVQWRTTAVGPAAGALLGVGLIAWDGDPDSATIPADPPDPVNDPEADWILSVVYPMAPNVPGGTIFSSVLDFLHESRAMRRLGNTRGLLLVSEATLANGSPAGFNFADVTVHCRYLLKE